jgi:formate dehydrogenase subunit beta
MNVNHILRLGDDDAAGTLRNFLSAWWHRAGLDAMLAPVELSDNEGVSPQVIEHPDELKRVNPFLPVMPANSASLVDGFIKDHPESHLAVMLRPCELRALVELQKRRRVQFPPRVRGNDQKSLIILGVDCPGTFPLAEYARRVASRREDAKMIRVGMAYDRKDCSIPHEVRTACHLCASPVPLGADALIGTIGIAQEGVLLVIARDEQADASLGLTDVTDGMADERQVVLREMMVGDMIDKNARRRSDLVNVQARRAEEFDSVMAMFARCTLCADCLDACPLYDGELAGMLGVNGAYQRTHPLLTELVSWGRWLASCSGCGMCQEACEKGVALTPLVVSLAHRIQHGLKYTPGDPNQPLPWSSNEA